MRQPARPVFRTIAESNGLDVIARELLVRIRLGHIIIHRRDREPEDILAPAEWTIDRPFIEAVRRNDQQLIRSTARESAHSIAVSLAANHSATTGQVIDIERFEANPPAGEIMLIAQPAFIG